MTRQNQLNKSQRTLQKDVFFKGIGLHTGNSCEMTLEPAPENSGIHFIDIGSENGEKIPATLEYVNTTYRGTNLKKGASSVNTVEHVLSALYGLQIDNVTILLKGGEPPAVDGSVLPFCEQILSSGIKEQSVAAKTLTVSKPLYLESGSCRAGYAVAPHLTIDFDLQYSNPLVGFQRYQFRHSPDSFLQEIASARTFGFQAEEEILKTHGLAKGASLENAIIIGSDRILNEAPLRFKDEFVRHKILDVMGDLCLLGRRVEGLVSFLRSGHTFNIQFARQLNALYNNSQRYGDTPVLNFEEIREIIPHRYPMLLVDRIVYLDDASAIGLKNVTGNEEYFQGHFPDKPVMPGVLVVEAMAQVAGVLVLSKDEHRGKTPYFTGINRLKIRRPVLPGDTIQLEVKLLKVRGNTGKFFCQASVNDKTVAEGELMFSLASEKTN